MKLVDGVWLPDGEKHFPEWWNTPGNNERIEWVAQYQLKKQREAFRHVKQWRVAVDVGGHVGMWSMNLVRRFRMVHAFEPVAEFRECFERNVRPIAERMRAAENPRGGSYLLYPCALGAEKGRVRMHVDPADTGGTHVAGPGEIEMRALDEFDLPDVDYFKVDCEGAEVDVVKGALDTLARCRPCCVIEQKQHKLAKNFGIKGTPAVDLILGLGAKVRKEISGDYFLSWD